MIEQKNTPQNSKISTFLFFAVLAVKWFPSLPEHKTKETSNYIFKKSVKSFPLNETLFTWIRFLREELSNSSFSLKRLNHLDFITYSQITNALKDLKGQISVWLERESSILCLWHEVLQKCVMTHVELQQTCPDIAPHEHWNVSAICSILVPVIYSQVTGTYINV